MDLKKIKPLREHPEFAQAAEEQARLNAALGKIQQRISEIETQLSSASQPDPHTASLDAALHFADTGEVKSSTISIANMQHEHMELRTQARSVQQAIEANRQRQDQIRGVASAEVLRDLQDDHRTLAGKYLKALRALDALHEEEQQIMSAIERAGYNAHFRTYIRWYPVGTAKDTHSLMAMRLKEISAYGYED